MNRRKVRRVELNVGTLNVGMMTGKGRALPDVMTKGVEIVLRKGLLDRVR